MFDDLILLVSLDFKTSWKMFTQRGEYVTVLTSTVIYSAIFLCQFSFGAHETSIRQLLWGFRPLAVKVMAKSDISIDYGPSATARLVAAS